MYCEYLICFPCLFVWRTCDECCKSFCYIDTKIKSVNDEKNIESK